MDDYPRDHASTALSLFSGWHFTYSAWCFWGGVAVFTFIVRFVMVYLRCVEVSRHKFPPKDILVPSLWGIVPGDENKEQSDFWFPALIGTCELIAFPVLLVTGQLTAIGAWIGFKAIAQWERWKIDRSPYNRFLFGNALVLFLSYALAYLFITPTR
jgi:hypothetical protein